MILRVAKLICFSRTFYYFVELIIVKKGKQINFREAAECEPTRATVLVCFADFILNELRHDARNINVITAKSMDLFIILAQNMSIIADRNRFLQ